MQFNKEYCIVYSFLQGEQLATIIANNQFDKDIIKSIANELRKIHTITKNEINDLPKVEFANEIERKSLLHFDLTKHNIFVDGKKVGFIDFDDAKYGDSVCDVAIIISLIFISKKNGFNIEGAKCFLEEYYSKNEEERVIEESLIKKYAIEWVDYILNNNQFDSSLRESFEFKRKVWKNI